MNKSLLDTDILSETTNGLAPSIVARAREYRPMFSRYTISAVTMMEVIKWYQRNSLCGSFKPS